MFLDPSLDMLWCLSSDTRLQSFIFGLRTWNYLSTYEHNRSTVSPTAVFNAKWSTDLTGIRLLEDFKTVG